MKLFLVLILFSTQAFAVCTEKVQYLTEGSKVECNGYLFTPEMELKVRTKIANYENMEELVKKTEELNTITETRLNNQLNQNEKLTASLNSQQQNTFWQNAGFFVLGVIVTGYIATNVKR